jgi:hypothetical protein
LLSFASFGRRRGLRFAGAVVTLLLIAFVVLQTSSPVLGTTVPVDATPTDSADGTPEPSGEVAEQLPPPDLPTTSEQGFTFDLRATLKADVDNVPTEASVYELEREMMSESEAQELADKLKIGGELEERGDDSFTVSGEGQLFISPDVIQYQSGEAPADGNLPSDDEAIRTAREWLRKSGLTPPDLGDGRVVSRVEQAKLVVVIFAPVEPENLLAAYPSITVTLGPEAEIVEASKRWADIHPADTYQLRSADDAWKDIQSGQAYIEAELTGAGLEAGADVTGTVTYNDISIGYTTAGPPDGNQYLEPVFVFRGRVRVEGQEKTYPIKAYVPALANSGAPVG